MTHQTPDAETAAIPDISAFFGLGPPITVARVNYGLSNRNYAVSTDQGKYVVRFLINQTLENIENEIAIQQQLRQAGIVAPHYVRNCDGAHLYHDSRGISAVVSKKIDGITPRHMTLGLAADIGRHLASFHTAVRTLPHPNTTGLLNPGVAVVTSEAAREVLDQPLPRGIIHGDLHCGNLLVDPLHPDHIVAILDFEEVAENLYVIDLAVTLMATSAGLEEDSIDLQLLRSVIDGYASVRRLTDEEITWLPQAIHYTSEAWINWFQTNGFDRYARQHERRYDSVRSILGAGTHLQSRDESKAGD